MLKPRGNLNFLWHWAGCTHRNRQVKLFVSLAIVARVPRLWPSCNRCVEPPRKEWIFAKNCGLTGGMILSRWIIFILIAASMVAIPFHARAALAVNHLEMRSENGVDQCVLHLSEAAVHSYFLLQNPDRLVINLPPFQGGSTLILPEDYTGTLVKAVRHGHFDPATSRIVLDLTRSVKVESVFELPPGADASDHRLVVQFSALYGKATPSAPAPEPIATPVPAAEKPEKSQNTYVPEDKKPLVVIDAGHGGVDPGTLGEGGVREKDLTLDYARALRRELLRTGRYRVAMTRDDDVFIFLQDRVKKARAAKGDMFISLHADSAPTKDARGLSIYTLSEQASDKEAAALAERENKVDSLGGKPIGVSKDVADILVDLARRETKARSGELAGHVLEALKKTDVNVLVNPHRFAGFAVLKAPDIPSVLIETGFLSHAAEEKQLMKSSHRDAIAHAVARAVDAYFADHPK